MTVTSQESLLPPADPTPAPTSSAPTAVTVRLRLAEGWFTAVSGARLTPGRGVAVLLPDGRQAALFLDRSGRAYAIDNRDPFTGAAVLSRGLVGSADGETYVASPLLKQRFSLASGRCLDDDEVRVAVYEARVVADEVPRLTPS